MARRKWSSASACACLVFTLVCFCWSQQLAGSTGPTLAAAWAASRAPADPSVQRAVVRDNNQTNSGTAGADYYAEGGVRKAGSDEDERAQAYREEAEELQSLLNWAIENSDPEKLRETAAEHKRKGEGWQSERMQEIREIMESVSRQKSEAEIMEEAIAILEAPESNHSHEIKLRSIEVLEDIVGQVDNANVFGDLGGAKLVFNLCDAYNESLCAPALQLLGVAASNNAVFQEKALLDVPNAVELLLGYTQADTAQVAVKAAFAASVILRNTVSARGNFYELGGLDVLVAIFSDETRPLNLRKKAVALASDLATLDGVSVASTFAHPHAIAGITTLLGYGDLDLSEKCLLLIRGLAQADPSLKADLANDSGLKAATDNLLQKMKQDVKVSPYLEELVVLWEELVHSLFSKNHKTEL
mmetsp:Transcript_4409/g.11443  ORF Transcript_4409/g.11443 Transcript_4409/m.11443 type:complete len:416 (-) Transcript_4409:201-1448(-)